MKRPENKEILNSIKAARKAGKTKKIWKEVERLLEKTSVEVNVSKISKYVQQGKTAVVPGKVLGAGELKHKVDVVALNFSESAKQKIKSAGGKTILISEIPEKGLNTELVLIR